MADFQEHDGRSSLTMTDRQREVVLLGDWLSWSPDSLPPSRWNRNIPFVTWIFANLGPRQCVEIGSGSGESFRPLCQIADRFSPKGQCIGIDPWKDDDGTSIWGRSIYEELRDRCETLHPDSASVLRMELDDAPSQFDPASIDFLHIAPPDRTRNSAPVDLSLWRPKLRAGSVVMVSRSTEDGVDDPMIKVWQLLSDWYPSAFVGSPYLAGVAQVPYETGAPLVEFLQSNATALSTFFRLLGERFEYRYVIGSDPMSPDALRRYFSQILSDHAEEVSRSDKQQAAALDALNEQIASINERLFVGAAEVNTLQAETDILLAKLASSAATYDREREDLHLRLSELNERHRQHLATLQHQINLRDIQINELSTHINAMVATRSWQITKPLRMIQRVLVRLRLAEHFRKSTPG